MVVLRSMTLAAIFAALWALPVGAQECQDGAQAASSDPLADQPPHDCLPLPPSSVQVNTNPAIGSTGTYDVDAPGMLVPVEASLPIPRAEVAPLVSAGAAPFFPKLSVPLRYQDPSDVSCGVQALGMALSAGSGSPPTSTALLGFLQSNNMMYDFGTGVEELAFAAQAFGYEGAVPFHGGDLSTLQSELSAGRPVVVSLGANGESQPGHFVTVTGISPDGQSLRDAPQWVSFNDPTLGEQVVPTSEFLRLWGLQGNSGVIVAREVPPAEPDPMPWVALAAGIMALVSTSPLGLRRQGIGGRIDAGTGGASKSAPAKPAPKPTPKPAAKPKPKPKPSPAVVREEAAFQASPPPPPPLPIPQGVTRAEEGFEGPVTQNLPQRLTQTGYSISALPATATPTPLGYTLPTAPAPTLAPVPHAQTAETTPSAYEIERQIEVAKAAALARLEAYERQAELDQQRNFNTDPMTFILREAIPYYDELLQSKYGTSITELVAPPRPENNPLSTNEIHPGAVPFVVTHGAMDERFLARLGLDIGHYANYDPVYLNALKEAYGLVYDQVVETSKELPRMDDGSEFGTYILRVQKFLPFIDAPPKE